MAITYTAKITEVKISGVDAAISAVMPHPQNPEQLVLSVSALVPRSEALPLRIEDTINVTLDFNPPASQDQETAPLTDEPHEEADKA